MQADHILTISTIFQGRLLNLYLLQSDTLFLIDSGVAGMPRDLIFPFMAEKRLSPDALTLLANTHAHADHMGGNAEIAARCPHVRIGAHELDKHWIEDHDRLWQEFYACHPLQRYSEKDREAMLELCGVGVPLQYSWKGGETLEIGTKTIEVVHAPGHTPGNLVFLDRENGVLFEGETILGGVVGVGQQRLLPFYYDVLAYRNTLDHLAALPWELLLSSHSAPRDRREGMSAIKKSLDLVDLVNDQVYCALVDAGEPVPVKDLVASLSERHQYEAMAPAWLAATHLNFLLEIDEACRLPDGRWRRAR
jgi:glyoxylase-like metal-dependent hydrolase (beta-lactamase superfamily II)